MKTAIITGASSGLGREYFKSALEQFPEVEEFWIISRNKEKLSEVARTAPPEKRVAAIALDLEKEESFEILQKILEETKPEVELLINNSGYGKLGDLADSDLGEQLGMIDLNVRGMTAMTRCVLPYLQDYGVILNVSSIASFVPTPGMTVYSSTKAYVTSFSKALREELKGRNISVTAVCPGPMDTGFNGVAGIGGGASPTFESLPKEDPATIASRSLNAACRGRPLYVGKLFYRLYHALSKLLSHGFLMRFTRL